MRASLVEVEKASTMRATHTLELGAQEWNNGEGYYHFTGNCNYSFVD